MNIMGFDFDLMSFLVSNIVGIVGVILGFIYFSYQRKKKRFSYQIISKSPLYSIHDDNLKDRLKIYLDETLVEDLNLIIIKFSNNGSVDISSRDFETPVYIDFNDEADILGNEIIDKYPETMDYDISSGGNRLQINQNLFNIDYFVTVKLLLKNYVEISQVHCGIFGVNEFELVSGRMEPEKLRRYLGGSTILMGLIANIINSNFANDTLAARIASYFYILFGIYIILNKNRVPFQKKSES